MCGRSVATVKLAVVADDDDDFFLFKLNFSFSFPIIPLNPPFVSSPLSCGEVASLSCSLTFSLTFDAVSSTLSFTTSAAFFTDVETASGVVVGFAILFERKSPVFARATVRDASAFFFFAERKNERRRERVRALVVDDFLVDDGFIFAAGIALVFVHARANHL